MPGCDSPREISAREAIDEIDEIVANTNVSNLQTFVDAHNDVAAVLRRLPHGERFCYNGLAITRLPDDRFRYEAGDLTSQVMNDYFPDGHETVAYAPIGACIIFDLAA